MTLKLIAVKPNSKSHQRVCLILWTHLSSFVPGEAVRHLRTLIWPVGGIPTGWVMGWKPRDSALGDHKAEERRRVQGLGVGWRTLELCYENEAGDLGDKGAAEQVERGRRPSESILAPWEKRLEQQGGGWLGGGAPVQCSYFYALI